MTPKRETTHGRQDLWLFGTDKVGVFDKSLQRESDWTAMDLIGFSFSGLC